MATSRSVSSSSDEDFQHILNERKRKRKVSNREAARRSRMRKQKQLDDLMGQVSHLTNESHRILTSINITGQLYLNIEAENSVLRAQMAELSTRLQSLYEIVGFINSSNGVFGYDHHNDYEAGHHHHLQVDGDTLMNINQWSCLSVNHQPIIATDDMIMY
ncbi:FLORAL TRANSITION AT THE MERISTEM3, G-BOX BINDING FACTOR 5, basic leucine-zipper 2 [Hibiscus trionum]|uniref:FLORAL TRANSITION AT THE MERISTEM3, G-BOX BINDING FACTOR 5, basic leucine-zipper 2 n=1 Tax=Hibiscus trionum TaxID=183268 RepID=A0A9W7HHG1_HIBTR|nr:FLORAL TRANSITION AT THE MERISTEM3, G-BOX BINDING FACTOR 5, basic leucine-zipper 2 [Hibiscus trionum]